MLEQRKWTFPSTVTFIVLKWCWSFTINSKGQVRSSPVLVFANLLPTFAYYYHIKSWFIDIGHCNSFFRCPSLRILSGLVEREFNIGNYQLYLLSDVLMLTDPDCPPALTSHCITLFLPRHLATEALGSVFGPRLSWQLLHCRVRDGPDSLRVHLHHHLLPSLRLYHHPIIRL